MWHFPAEGLPLHYYSTAGICLCEEKSEQARKKTETDNRKRLQTDLEGDVYSYHEWLKPSSYLDILSV